MSITWILVANARHARLFANHGPNKGLELLSEAQAQRNEAAIKGDPGRLSRHADAGKQVSRSFAHRLARDLFDGRQHGRFARAILVAPPAFMGLLNAELDGPTASLVSDRLDKDYTRSASQDLRDQLQGCLCA